MSAHTPTPWRVNTFTQSIYADEVPKGPMRVADIRGWGYLTGKGQGALGMSKDDALEIQKANAAFIIKAVNRDHHFDALVKALEGLLPWLEDAETKCLVGDEGCVWAVEHVRDILASVGGSR